jgi:hypothetical protein
MKKLLFTLVILAGVSNALYGMEKSEEQKPYDVTQDLLETIRIMNADLFIEGLVAIKLEKLPVNLEIMRKEADKLHIQNNLACEVAPLNDALKEQCSVSNKICTLLSLLHDNPGHGKQVGLLLGNMPNC